jgi:hypothetical protein
MSLKRLLSGTPHFLVAAAIACGGSSPPGNKANAGSSGAGVGSGSGGSTTGTKGPGGSGAGSVAGSSGGSGEVGVVPPPEPTPTPICKPSTSDATAATLDFTNNLMPSPAPPGNLSPQSAPQIVSIGWDDVESLPGIQFITTLLGSVKNPNPNPNTMSPNATANLNANACYAYDPAYSCGDGSLESNRSVVGNLVTTNGWAMGNHTIDHLEDSEPLATAWKGIPTQYKDTVNGGWLPCSTGPAAVAGHGVGDCMDEATWQTILPVNEAALKTDYSVAAIKGFRAPFLEVNDNGLQAVKAIGYEYDTSLEETLTPGGVGAMVGLDTDSMQGYNWIPWPYTLDNGSPGIWNQQSTGDQAWVTSFPTGLWEVPTYEVYVPSANGLGMAIANTMLKADASCTFPPGTPASQMGHCFLGEGELSPGDSITEVTGFDFNLFVYSRMTPDQWLTVMKHTFLARYYGNRAPLTYGSHPIEYTFAYDSYTLGSPGCDTGVFPDGGVNTCIYSPEGNPQMCCQANNYGYRDVTMYSTYMARQMAMTQFVQWIQNDPTLSKDTYFLSSQDLANYMQHPFDKTGAPVQPDAVASPDSNGLFSRLGWTTQGATFTAMSGNSATIAFNVPAADVASGNPPAVVYAEAAVAPGSLKGVSHIDIKYNTQIPFRIRLLTSDGSTSVSALLAGVGGDRLARIRIKDFFPGAFEASAAQLASTNLVDANYMAKVTGIAFESAATLVAPSGTPGTFAPGTFTTQIEQITLHGVATSALCSP